MASNLLLGTEKIACKGDYFIFSDDENYLYGSGKIELTFNNKTVSGERLYLDIEAMTGVLIGNIKSPDFTFNQPADAFFFKGFPMNYYVEFYRDHLVASGKQRFQVKKKKIENLKKGSVYYEFRAFEIGPQKKIRAQKVIPYIMGFPSLPFKKFTIKRGKIPEKTMLYPESLNYSGVYGLTLSTLFRVRSPFLRGDNKLKLFERGIFGMNKPYRGLIMSGTNHIFINNQKALDLSILASTEENSINMVFEFRKQSKHLNYFVSQTFSAKKDNDVFYDFKTGFRLRSLKYIKPSLQFSHNLRKSYSYQFAMPIDIIKKISMKIEIFRKIFKDKFKSDTLDFASSVVYPGPFFKISSNYKTTRNFLDASLKRNFSFNLNFNPLYFENRTISITLSTFYLFSELPINQVITKRFTPGFNLIINGGSLRLPLGFHLKPILSINHIWDNQSENYTDFNTGLSLEKNIGRFNFSVVYSLLSHYNADHFWVEGYNTNNLKFGLDYKKLNKIDLGLKLLTDNHLSIESLLLNGKLNFKNDISLSTLMIYYYQERRVQTFEIFLEKNFKNVFKLQGGYSLSLKKFFVKVLSI